MKSTVMALATVLATVGQTVAQEGVLYCTDEDAAGFNQSTDGDYRRAGFKGERFTMVVNENRTITMNSDGRARTLQCQDDPFDASRRSCSTNLGIVVNYNMDTKRYTRMSGFGYVFGDGDSVYVAIGTCGAF